jgi:hypothetical protein
LYALNISDSGVGMAAAAAVGCVWVVVVVVVVVGRLAEKPLDVLVLWSSSGRRSECGRTEGRATSAWMGDVAEATGWS